ncbi:uncharacterized protein LOC133335870 [Musca vetustissima]|uniref:uncharacterized protein LOC133335870 n=1 Tax=Musca vetustissima TaxID=27455 RepID=UPI002AB65FB5|nr:uncharacterized protein LOC133335870 [Musca vetustissima]
MVSSHWLILTIVIIMTILAVTPIAESTIILLACLAGSALCPFSTTTTAAP